MSSALDRPVWNALRTRHAAFSTGDEHARRFVADVGPLAASRDDEPESLRALAALVPERGTLLLLQGDEIVLPSELAAVMTAEGVQMVAERTVAVEPDPRITRLGSEDAPAMLALATLTRPGPFALGTHALGEFWGIKEAGVLVAMAGERMKHDGFTEVSAVCTHPEVRGRGLARLLSAWVATRIFQRGETPYLHSYAANTTAIELYRSLGFAIRRPMNVAAIARK